MTVSLQPSAVSDRYWIQAWAPEAGKVGPRVGKWLVFVRAGDVDKAWRTISQALEAGRLGPAAKVRTARPHPMWIDDDVRPICVYTADAEDASDRQRVWQALLDLGFKPHRYKTDEERRLGDCWRQ